MPGMTDDMFVSGGMTADFNQIKKSLSEFSGKLRRKKLVHVKDSKGTDVEFEVSWKDWNLDDNGICNRPRMITNLPAGKAFVLPKEGTMNGVIVIDGTWESTLLEEPLELTVENGIVIDIKETRPQPKYVNSLERQRQNFAPKIEWFGQLLNSVSE